MKTLFKRILITTLSLVLLLSFMITPTSKVSAAEQLENKYPNLRITNLEPSDVDYENAIYIDTQEEYETLLKSLNAISESEIIVPVYSSEVKPYASAVSPTSSLKISDIYTTHIGFIPLPPIYMNIQFNFKSTYNSTLKAYTFTSISNINSWLTGLQFPVACKWTHKGTSYYYTNNRRNVYVTVSGVIGTTIIYNGLPQLIEENASYQGNWTAR